jgi:type III secretion protein C|nr:type III secretion system outer membrane ring subunit SctC [uncultured Caldimonas sp.]
MSLYLRLAVLSLMLCSLVLPAGAAELQWRDRSFQIVASEKPLPDFLRELASSQGTTAVVDNKVSGLISGKFTGSARKILDSICASYGLTWYFDGSFLYVDLASEARSEVISISPGSASRVAQTIVALKISDSRYPLSISDNEGSVFVSGPRRYVEMVRQAVKLADQRASMTDNSEVRLFPLKYAWAADFRINRSGRQTVVPGVATVLNSLYKGKGGSGGGSAGTPVGSPLRVGPNREVRMRSGDALQVPQVDMGGGGEGMAASFGTGADGELPQFHADTRMNAVLVRDLPERMPQYARIIESMDVRPRLIEIELTIMDISTDTLDSLGVDWRAHGRHADVQIGRGTGTPLTWNSGATEAGQTGSAPPAGGVFTAAIGNELRNYLLARVHALTKTGDANFVARPKVLTLDNNEAILENLNELYVRVDGFQDAALFNITAGTSVRVTPLIVDEATARGVMMSIDIQDGDLSQATVDDIPVVRRRTVNTQALVTEGASLLIAGYSSEENTNAVTGVPILSDVPVLGNLFKYTEKRRVKLERFYMLTPRMVLPSAQGATPPAGG